MVETGRVSGGQSPRTRARYQVKRGLAVATKGLGVLLGLSAWSLLFGYGLERQVRAGDWPAVAFLGLWLLAPYGLVAGTLAARLDRGIDRLQPIGRVAGGVLAATTWFAIWAGPTIWLSSIGTQLANGAVLVAGVRVTALLAPVVLAGLWFISVGALPVDRDMTA